MICLNMIWNMHCIHHLFTSTMNTHWYTVAPDRILPCQLWNMMKHCIKFHLVRFLNRQKHGVFLRHLYHTVFQSRISGVDMYPEIYPEIYCNKIVSLGWELLFFIYRANFRSKWLDDALKRDAHGLWQVGRSLLRVWKLTASPSKHLRQKLALKDTRV